ncbi:hypothetical protein UlMin_031762 [Ulmus minor]
MSELLWNKFKDESAFALYSPFFVCLAAGNLVSHTFYYCLGQELHFLKAFVHALKQAEEGAEGEFEENIIGYLKRREYKNLESHDRFIKRMGFKLPKENIAASFTIKYTDFLIETASGKIKIDGEEEKFETDCAYTLAAIAPCMRLYAHLCCQIKDILDHNDPNNMYKKWFNNNASQVFEESARLVEGALQNACCSFTRDELELLDKVYHQALKFDIGFFAAQPIYQRTIVPLARENRSITLMCEFDKTCISLDSSHVLAAVSTVAVAKVAMVTAPDLSSTWSSLFARYNKEVEECLENIMSRTEKKFNIGNLREALEDIGQIEKAINTRVEELGVLKGLTLDNIKRAGQNLNLQNGCISFLHKILKNESLRVDVHVLSHSWSGDIIRSALSSDWNVEIEVHSNELAYDEEFVTTGEIVKKVECSSEKLRIVSDHIDEEEDYTLNVYIGSSVRDLCCLVEADIGIVIGSNPSLRKLGNHFGISFIPLLSGLVRKQKQLSDDIHFSEIWKPVSCILYTVSNWTEIEALFLGL